MTREEAAILIGNIAIAGDDCAKLCEYQEAKAMAIEALLKQSNTQNALYCAKQIVEAIPSTHPNLTDDEEKAIWEVLGAVNQQPSEDCISRQAVVNKLANTNFWLSSENWREIIKAIESLPSVTPQPKMGHWIHKKNALGEEITVCNKCGKQMRQGEINFCGACGSDNREVSE